MNEQEAQEEFARIYFHAESAMMTGKYEDMHEVSEMVADWVVELSNTRYCKLRELAKAFDMINMAADMMLSTFVEAFDPIGKIFSEVKVK